MKDFDSLTVCVRYQYISLFVFSVSGLLIVIRYISRDNNVGNTDTCIECKINFIAV
jgi:hypothetical protein